MNSTQFKVHEYPEENWRCQMSSSLHQPLDCFDKVSKLFPGTGCKAKQRLTVKLQNFRQPALVDMCESCHVLQGN